MEVKPISPVRPLPAGADGIAFGRFRMRLAKNKVIFGLDDGTGDHITLHAGPGGEADIHKTRYLANGEVVHERLFAITHEVLVAVLQDMAIDMPAAMLRLVRPFRIRYSSRRHIEVVVGVLPTPEILFRDMKTRKRKVRVDADTILARAWTVDSFSELYGLEPGEIFTVIEYRPGHAPRIAGHGFSLPYAKRYRRLAWIPLPRMQAFIRKMGQAMQESYALHQELPAREESEPSRLADIGK
jgi:hypothetical protein